MGNKTLLESPPGAGGITDGDQDDPIPPFGGGSAPYRY